MLRRIHLNYIIFTNSDMIANEIIVIIQPKNISFELSDLSTTRRYVIYIKSNKSVLNRQITIFQSKSMLDKLIVKYSELIFFLLMSKHLRLILVISEENAYFCLPLIHQIKYIIYNPLVFFKGI